MPAIEDDAERLEAQVLGVGGNPDRNDGDLRRHALGLAVDLDVERDTVFGLREPGNPRPDAKRDAAFPERFQRRLGHLLVLDRQYPRESLHDGDLRA